MVGADIRSKSGLEGKILMPSLAQIDRIHLRANSDRRPGQPVPEKAKGGKEKDDNSLSIIEFVAACVRLGHAKFRFTSLSESFRWLLDLCLLKNKCFDAIDDDISRLMENPTPQLKLVFAKHHEAMHSCFVAAATIEVLQCTASYPCRFSSTLAFARAYVYHTVGTILSVVAFLILGGWVNGRMGVGVQARSSNKATDTGTTSKDPAKKKKKGQKNTSGKTGQTTVNIKEWLTFLERHELLGKELTQAGVPLRSLTLRMTLALRGPP